MNGKDAYDPYADADDGPGGKDMSTIMKYQNQENIAPAPAPVVPVAPVAPKPQSRGKDIENVYGIKDEDEENGRPLPVGRKKKKKKSRKLTALDSDEDADESEESEEYKASE